MARRSKLLMAVGLVLVLGGVGLFLFARLSATTAKAQATQMVAELNRLLPDRWAGNADVTGQMPALSFDGQDVVALVEIPDYGVALPVGNQWSARGVTAYPRRFSGSVYDRNLVVGGADRLGQLDCLDVIEDGATVTVTDMTGGVFSYTVTRVERSKTAEAQVLTAGDYDLTLFVRDTYSLEYILVRCAMK